VKARVPEEYNELVYIAQIMLEKVDFFLNRHGITADHIDMQKVVDRFTAEMLLGLEGKKSSLRMIPTYIETDHEFLTEVPVVAIDAGGTNFRAGLVSLKRNGQPDVTDMVNEAMPGIEGEISREAFFNTMAGYVRPLAEKADGIGFCFSYPTEILPDKDGILLQFSKEVQAPDVVGQLIGKNLLEALGMTEKKIVLLNDTAATLLAGKAATAGEEYDSYIGYILGTGTNTCYIEKNSNILKKPDLDPSGRQIINIESGAFGKAPRTDIDLVFDRTTNEPGKYTFEKMFSGGYLGGLCLSVLKTAANEGVFTPDTTNNLLSLDQLTTGEVNDYIRFTATGRGPLNICIRNRDDEASCVRIIDTLIDRAAKLVAANLASVVLKTEKGTSRDRPVLLTIEGTVFYKLHNFKSRFEKYFRKYLSGDKQRFYQFTGVQQSSLIGAALAALID